MHRGCGVAAAAALHRVHRRKPVYLQRVAAAERIFKKSASVEKISNGFCCCVLLWCRFWIFWCATAFGVHFLDRLVLC